MPRRPALPPSARTGRRSDNFFHLFDVQVNGENLVVVAPGWRDNFFHLFDVEINLNGFYGLHNASFLSSYGVGADVSRSRPTGFQVLRAVVFRSRLHTRDQSPNPSIPKE